MEKEMVQKMEWLEAQKIELSVDLVAAAKQQLQFLGVVDQNPWLYHGPIVERAIYRYNAYWLPLLAKYSESSLNCEGPIVPPLDCEWVWHCHRLNPVRYKSDCEQFYGRVLDNSCVVSSTNGSCKLQTENLWKRLYPMEPYDLDVDKAISDPEDISVLEKCTTYDLVSAVKRQSSFYYEVSRAHEDNDIMIKEAVRKYKAFLYLFKKNNENSTNLIGVPTYDIDLIWHTHQLHPSSYYKDTEKIFGNILQHDDDTESDKSKCETLDTVFSGTTAQWEETFGQKYWKARVETTTFMVAAEKSGWAARCFVEKKDAGAKYAAKVAEENGAGGMCAAKVVEKNGANARSHCVFKVFENHDVGAKCAATVVEKHGAGARCFALATEKKSAKCRAVVAEKNGVGAKCTAKVVGKHGSGARCIGARCFAMAAEKNSAKCRAVVAEQNGASAKCTAKVVVKHGSGARCFAMAAEKNSPKCRAVVTEQNGVGAKCTAKVVGKHGSGARCFAMAAEKNSAKCRAVVAEQNGASAKCAAKVVEKHGATARCFALAAEKNSAKCRGVVAEKNGGCGNMVKNNANENVPLA